MKKIYFLGVLGGFLFFPVFSHAVTINVTTTVDSLDDDGFCSLREAIRNANQDRQVDNDDCAAGSDADTVSIPAGTYILSLGAADTDANEIDSASGDLDIFYDEVTLSGAGSSSTIIDASGLSENAYGDRDRVLEVRSDTHLQDLTLTGGKVSYDGGGIRVNGSDIDLVLTRCSVTANTVTGSRGSAYGGGINLYGASLTLTDSSVTGNVVSAPTTSGSY